MKASVLPAALVLGLFATPAFAQSAGFYLPTGVTSYGQDEFRAADGTTCRSTMDGTKRIEVGAYGSGNRSNDNSYSLPGYYGQGNGNNAGVYGRFTMSLDAAPDRMNCNILYKLELERRSLELEMMKRSLTSADRALDDHLKQSANAPSDDAPAPKTAGKSGMKATKVAASKKGGFPPP